MVGAAPRRWSAFAPLVVLVAAACAGSASDPGATTTRYVSSVCGAVLHWRDIVEIRASSLIGEDPSPATDAVYMRGVRGDTATMVQRVQAAGAASTPGGGELQAAVRREVTTLRSNLVAAVSKDLAANDQVDAVRHVAVAIGSEVRALRSELPLSRDSEVARAARSAFNCRMLFRRSPIDLGA